MFHDFDLNQLVIKIVTLLFAVSAHEAAHGYAAYRMGDNTAKLAGRLTLNPIKHLDLVGSFLLPAILAISHSPFIFGYAKPVPVNFSNLRNYRKGTIFVASAGVLANLALAIASGIFYQVLLLLEPFSYNAVFRLFTIDIFLFLGYSVMLNILLAIFNILPIPPLDGSRIVALFMPASLKRQYKRMQYAGIVIIMFLLMTDSLNGLFSFIPQSMKFLLGSNGFHLFLVLIGAFK